MITVLIVEDDERMIQIWESFLAPLECVVRIAMTIREAMDEMRRVPFPDIVLLDLRLPGSNSAEDTLRQIEHFKAVNPKAVVVVLTGMVDKKLPELAAELGADGYSQKLDCANQTALFGVISQALTKRTQSSKAPAFETSLALLETLTRLTCPVPENANQNHETPNN